MGLSACGELSHADVEGCCLFRLDGRELGGVVLIFREWVG